MKIFLFVLGVILALGIILPNGVIANTAKNTANAETNILSYLLDKIILIRNEIMEKGKIFLKISELK